MSRRFPRRFHDRLGFRLPGVRDLLRIAATGGFGDAQAQRPLAAQVPRANPGPELPRGDGVAWAGHSSFVLRLAGRTFLTDPVWSPRLPGRNFRVTGVGVPWERVGPVDGVLVSHNHYDHLDAGTMRRLPRDTPVFAPANLGRWFWRRGFTDVVEMDWWESVDHRGVTVHFVPSHHWSRRGLFDANASLWGSWVLEPPGKAPRAFFAGDTGYGPRFREVGARFDGFGLAILPIGAYEPRWFMRAFHETPEEAVQAFLDLGARRLVPGHWGAFVLSREPLLEPPERLRAEWARLGLERERLWDLALGESREIPRSA